jgi:hypothetical protein
VVAYVGSATDYKKQSDTFRVQLQAEREKQNKATKELEQRKTQFEQAERDLSQQITSLKSEVSRIQSELAAVKRDKANLLDEASKWKAAMASANTTYSEQGKLLENTLTELDKARADRTKMKKELDETSNELIQKLAVIETLEKKIRALEEETAELQSRLSAPLIPLGKRAAPAMPVTPQPTAVKTAMPATNIDLRALVTAVDMKNSMASISLGSVDGVREGMRFHVTRGGDFICDILIISVDVEESVGVLEMIQYQPQMGDSASTNL